MDNKKRGKIFFKSKKGISHELFFNVFELVLATIVILALLFFVNDVAKQTIFEKNYMARDLALLINTFYASPGEIVYNYNENIEDFIFNFGGNKVEITNLQDKEPKVFYPFAENKNIPFQDKTLSYEKEFVKIKFWKSMESISVNKFYIPNLDVASATQTQFTDEIT